MSEISMKDLRANLSDVLSKAEYAGEATYVTRHKRKSAVIVPVNEWNKLKELVAALEDKLDLKEALEVKASIEAGEETVEDWNAVKDEL